MPKLVDKEERKKEIALSCKDLFMRKGIKALTIAEVAKSAGIGKGTVYEYFKNKDEVIFTIVDILSQEKDRIRQEHMDKLCSTKDKLKLFFKFFYDEDHKDLRKLYKEFISINLISPNEAMLNKKAQKHKKYQSIFDSILQEGIAKGEIDGNAMKLANGLHTLGIGFFIVNNISNITMDIKQEIDEYIDTLFEFIKVKK